MFKNLKIGIVGLGMVGTPLKRYFEEKGLIIDGHKGVLWIYNPSPKLRKAIESSREI